MGMGMPKKGMKKIGGERPNETKGQIKVLKEPLMDMLYANASISVNELKKNPAAIIEEAAGFPVVVLDHNRPTAYLVSATAFEAMMEKLDDIELAKLVKARANGSTVTVEPDDL